MKQALNVWGGWEGLAGKDAVMVLDETDLLYLAELEKRFEVVEQPVPVMSEEEHARSGSNRKFSTIVARRFRGQPPPVTERR